jgi:hypothetical protein
MPNNTHMNKKQLIAFVGIALFAGVIGGLFSSGNGGIVGALAPIRQKESFTQGFYAGTTRQLSVDNSGNLTIPTSSYLTSVGWDYLGSVKLAATAASTSVVTVAKRDVLEICVNVTSYAGTTDIASLIFNGDTGADYASRFLSIANSTTTVVDNATTSATVARLFAVGQTQGRVACTVINNNTTKDKFYAVTAYSGTGTATSTGMMESGGGEWATTTQITSIKLTTAGGGNLASGTGFVVLGKNF